MSADAGGALDSNAMANSAASAAIRLFRRAIRIG
jgi:hypothetical protein